jgi:hypothetical protein
MMMKLGSSILMKDSATWTTIGQQSFNGKLHVCARQLSDRQEFVPKSFGKIQTETVPGGDFYDDVWWKIRLPLKQRNRYAKNM